jgi:hypothetical protein
MTEPVVPSTPTTLPAAPDPTTASSTFDSLAYAFTVAQNPWATSLSVMAGQTYTNAVSAKEKADIAVANAGTASSAAGTATSAATLAESWATSTAIVSGGLYGARYYAQQAQTLIGGYKGALSSDPLSAVAGDWYISTTSGFVRAYNGTSWVNGISAVAGVSSVNGLTGSVVLDVPSTARVFFMSGV